MLGFPISLNGTAATAAAALPLGVPHSVAISFPPSLLSELLCSSLVSTQTASPTNKIEFFLLVVRAFLLLSDFWLSVEVRVRSLVMGYLSKALEPREPMVGGCWWLLLDLPPGSEQEEEGCLW